MFGLDYNYLSHIKDTKGREAAYAEQLKVDYYKKEFGQVQEKNNYELIRASEHSGALVREAIEDFNTALSEQYEELSDSLSDLSEGLIDISDELENIGSELNHISGILDWGFNAVIENQRLTLLTLTGIAELSKIPDREKERIMLIQRGIERQHEAFYNPVLFKNAVKNYLQALDLYEEDPFVLNRLGFIHLYSKEDIDFEAAAKYFELAVAYILPKYQSKKHLSDQAIYDHMPGLLAPQLFKDLRQQTSISLFYAAQANLLLNEPGKSRQFLSEALLITPEFQEAKYLYIKTLLLLGELRPIEALVTELLEQSPLYYFKFEKDQFFLKYPHVIHYTGRFYQHLKETINDSLDEINGMMGASSALRRHFQAIQAAFRTGHFLGLVRAQRMLNKEIIFSFKSLQYEA